MYGFPPWYHKHTMRNREREPLPVHNPEECPMTRVIGIIASKWALPVLYHLLRAPGPLRFGVLQKAIGRVTHRELSLTLKRFEEVGIARRKVYPEVPLRVEYSLTPLGRSLEEPILGLGRWAERNSRRLAAAGGTGKPARRRSSGSAGPRL
jgi:DNA-binding HxlR family transcriptional regulator